MRDRHPHARPGHGFGRPARRPHAHGFDEPGRGRRGRLFESGGLRHLILHLIAEAPRHGYDIIREFEERTGGAYSPSPGVIYPTLSLLLETGLIEEVPGEGARKRFAVTDLGRAELERSREAVLAALKPLEALAERGRRLEPAPIARALQNLKTALRDRLAEAGDDRDLVLQAARLIDEAASAVERL